MANNRFDFEVAAKDEASATLKGLEETVRKMLPALDQAGEKLKLGGQETSDGLGSLGGKLSQLSAFAKSGVQYFGDMVPPLKMVGGLADRYGGMLLRMGGVGALAYGAARGVSALAGGLADAGKEAYNLGVQSKDAGMKVHDLTQVAGAMEILGADTDTARASVEALSRSLTEAYNGRKADFTAMMNDINAPIYERADHTADTMKTLEKLAEIFPSLGAQKQKTVADFLGLTPEMLALLREGARYKQLLTKSDQFGLTVSDSDVEKLNDVNTQLTEISARMKGLKRESKNAVYSALLSDGSIKDSLVGVNDVLQHGPDNIALMHVLGVTRGKEADELREILQNGDLYNSMSLTDKVSLDFGMMTDSIRQKYADWHRPVDKANQLMRDVNAANHPASSHPTAIPPINTANYGQPDNHAFGLRNNNPGNLREAPNASGTVLTQNGPFVRFGSQKDGLAALSRQLMLYGDRGKNTLADFIPTYAPKGENNTQAYITDVSRKTGFSPDQKIDLHSPVVLERLIAAMISHEQGTQPFSLQEIQQGINEAIVDPRWSGKRDSQQLLAQRRLFPAVVPPERLPPAPSQERQHINAPQTQEAQPSSSIVTQPGHQVLVTALTQAILQAQKDGKNQIEVILTNDQTGERRVVSLPPGGKVTTSMGYR